MDESENFLYYSHTPPMNTNMITPDIPQFALYDARRRPKRRPN